jgi:hypothetical protein
MLVLDGQCLPSAAIPNRFFANGKQLNPHLPNRLALVKSVAWNLLSFRPEFGRNPGNRPPTGARSPG